MESRMGQSYLLGSQLLSLDNKHRFCVPVLFQRMLERVGAKKFFVTFGLGRGSDERYLEIWPDALWIGRVQEIMAKVTDPQLRAFYSTYYIDPASMTGVDKQWRMVLQPHHRQFLGVAVSAPGQEGEGGDEDTGNMLYIVGAQDHMKLYRWSEFMATIGRERNLVPAADMDARMKVERLDTNVLLDTLRQQISDAKDKEE